MELAHLGTSAVPTNGARKPHSGPLLAERMVSHAQTGEDVVLQRAFARQPLGFYIDVGACDPAIDSVTLHFYERGWHGVNIEPDRRLFALFAPARERDTNICAAVGGIRGKRDFFPTGTRGHGTLSEELAVDRTEGAPPERVPIMTLNDVFDCYGPDDGVVDFLKIDVEGSEADVIVATDWTRHRPRVVVVEAVDTLGRPTHEQWEPVLLEAGYRLTLFDGLNRFYCRAEDDALIPALSSPANPIDNWIRAEELRVIASVASLQNRLDALRREHTEVVDQNSALRADIDAARADIHAARTAESIAIDRCASLNAEVAAARDRGNALEIEITRARSEIAAAVGREDVAVERLAAVELEQWRCEIDLMTLRDDRERETRERYNLLSTLAELTAARYDAQTVVAGMRATFSWRITAPLRIAARIARSTNFRRPAKLDRLMRRLVR